MADYSEEITAFLESHLCVSSRWLANTLQITVTKAIEVLDAFKRGNTNVVASYLLSGKLQAGGRSFAVSTEDNLESTRAQFAKGCSSQIYSVQKNNNKNCAQIMLTLDYEQTVEIMNMQHPNSQNFLDNSIGLVQCTKVDIKPLGERILSNTTSNIVVDRPSSVASKMGTSKASAEKSISTLASSSSSNGMKLSTGSTKAVSNFFGNSKAKEKTDESVTGTTMTKPTVVSADDQSKRKQSDDEFFASLNGDTKKQKKYPKKSNAEAKDDSDEEWDDGSNVKKGVNSKKSKAKVVKSKANETKASPERKKKADATNVDKIDATDEADQSTTDLTNDKDDNDNNEDKDDKDNKEDEDDDDDDDNEAESKEAKKAARKKRKQAAMALQRGGMDDYFEDKAVSAYNEENAPSGGGDVKRVKRTKKVLVEKMFTDDKGYLVMEQVYEDVTDDELPRPYVHQPADSSNSKSEGKEKEKEKEKVVTATDKSKEKENTTVKEKKPNKKTNDKKKEKDKGSGTQKSMMSFFGKMA